MTIEERHALLLEAIREMLDYSTGWTRNPSLSQITKVGNDALIADYAASLEKK